MKRATALAVPVRRLSRSISPAISSQFTLEVCTAVENRKKTLEPFIWVV